MSRSPVRAGVLGALALTADVTDELLLGTARDVHRALARRAHRATGRPGRGPAGIAHRVHDAVSGTVYESLSRGLRATSGRLRAADGRGLGPRMEMSPRGRFAVAAVNGIIGDRLARERPDLAITMAVRRHGQDVPCDPNSLAAGFPSATEDVVVFVHGLSESEEAWDRDGGDGSYAERLDRDTSWTPLLLRVNTGLPIAENGVALASLLDDLVAAWPVPVRRIAFVGHSMGGLIVRSACAVRSDPPSPAPWSRLVTNVVCLGTPHLGAPLERTVALGSRLLGVIPESAPFGRILEYRSVGILDLRAGLAPDVQHLPHACYHLVAATLAASPRHPVSEVFGDLLVRYPSAVGRPRRGRAMFPDADVLHVRGGHFDLLNHPEVHDALVTWLR